MGSVSAATGSPVTASTRRENLLAHCDAFLTNDVALRRVSEIRVLLVDSLTGAAVDAERLEGVTERLGDAGFTGLMIFGKSFGQVLPNILVLFLYGAVCMAIGMRLFRFRAA